MYVYAFGFWWMLNLIELQIMSEKSLTSLKEISPLFSELKSGRSRHEASGK
jgi:hypothetical protein